LVSQIGINYRHGSLSSHAGDEDFEVKAGDRMPYFLIDGKNVFDSLQQPKFHFLVFSTEANDFRALKNEVGSRYAELMDFKVFSISVEGEETFGSKKGFCVLLRPDNHIALIRSEVSLDSVREYLAKFIK